MRARKSLSLCVLLAACLLAAQPQVTITPDVQAALDRISAASLRGNLSFLSSDLLEGRDTPSRGLDIAAEFIASQFRRATLEPAGDDGYFQTAHLVTRKANLEGFTLELSAGEEHFTAKAADVAISSPAALDLTNAPLVKPDAAEPIAGKVLIGERRDFARGSMLRDPAIPLVILVGTAATRGNVAALRIPNDPEGKGPVLIRLSG